MVKLDLGRPARWRTCCTTAGLNRIGSSSLVTTVSRYSLSCIVAWCFQYPSSSCSILTDSIEEHSQLFIVLLRRRYCAQWASCTSASCASRSSTRSTGRREWRRRRSWRTASVWCARAASTCRPWPSTCSPNSAPSTTRSSSDSMHANANAIAYYCLRTSKFTYTNQRL